MNLLPVILNFLEFSKIQAQSLQTKKQKILNLQYNYIYNIKYNNIHNEKNYNLPYNYTSYFPTIVKYGMKVILNACASLRFLLVE